MRPPAALIISSIAASAALRSFQFVWSSLFANACRRVCETSKKLVCQTDTSVASAVPAVGPPSSALQLADALKTPHKRALLRCWEVTDLIELRANVGPRQERIRVKSSLRNVLNDFACSVPCRRRAELCTAPDAPGCNYLWNRPRSH